MQGPTNHYHLGNLDSTLFDESAILDQSSIVDPGDFFSGQNGLCSPSYFGGGKVPDTLANLDAALDSVFITPALEGGRIAAAEQKKKKKKKETKRIVSQNGLFFAERALWS